jgi:hypothetical protein
MRNSFMRFAKVWAVVELVHPETDKFTRNCGIVYSPAAGLDKLQGGGDAAPAPSEEKEGDEEGEKAPEPAPVAASAYSNNAAPLFSVLGADRFPICVRPRWVRHRLL